MLGRCTPLYRFEQLGLPLLVSPCSETLVSVTYRAWRLAISSLIERRKNGACHNHELLCAQEFRTVRFRESYSGGYVGWLLCWSRLYRFHRLCAAHCGRLGFDGLFSVIVTRWELPTRSSRVNERPGLTGTLVLTVASTIVHLSHEDAVLRARSCVRWVQTSSIHSVSGVSYSTFFLSIPAMPRARAQLSMLTIHYSMFNSGASGRHCNCLSFCEAKPIGPG